MTVDMTSTCSAALAAVEASCREFFAFSFYTFCYPAVFIADCCLDGLTWWGRSESSALLTARRILAGGLVLECCWCSYVLLTSATWPQPSSNTFDWQIVITVRPTLIGITMSGCAVVAALTAWIVAAVHYISWCVLSLVLRTPVLAGVVMFSAFRDWRTVPGSD